MGLVGQIIVAIGGGGVLVVGLATWVGRIWANRFLEKYKKEMEKSVFVHRVQFEKEFRVYEDIWKVLVRLGESTRKLRPVVDSHPKGMTEEEVKKMRLSELSQAYRDYWKLVFEHRPFIADEVFDSSKDILRLANIESVKFLRTPSMEDLDKYFAYFEEGAKNVEEMESMIDSVCDSIKKRIGIMNIRREC